MMQRLRKGVAFLLVFAVTLGACGAAEGFVYDEWESLARGAKGEYVEALQERLIELGYLTDSADGEFGARTEAAVMAFQAAVGLEETGIADAETMAAILAEDAPPAESATGVESGVMVWIPRTGQRYHSNKKCSGMKEPSYVTIEEARRLGFTPCKKCYR